MSVGAVEVHSKLRRDPCWFLETVLGFHPWSKQREIIESVRDNPRTAVRSCHGAGKTAIAARTALWFLAAHPGSRVLTTAPTHHQVREILWREIHRAVNSSSGFVDGELLDTKLQLSSDWFAIGLSTDRPTRFAGHHADDLLLVVDEASGVDEGIFEAAAGSLTGPGARMLMIGNPTTTSGEFFSAFHSARSVYNTIPISAFDTPAFSGERVPAEVLRALVSPSWVETAEQRWGEDSPIFQVRVKGEFPSTTDDAVISLADVEAAQTRHADTVGGPVVVACDVARFGSDSTVIALRCGNRVRIAKTYSSRDTMETVGAIIEVAKQVTDEAGNRPTVVVDDAGVGGGVVDRLREQGWHVDAFLGANRAMDSESYPNKRSEAWFAFQEQLPSIDLDDNEELAADLVAPTYKLDSSGRRVVEQKSETKKRLRRSPDRADAVLMAFAPAPPRTESVHYGTRGELEPVYRVGDLVLRGEKYIDQPSPA